MRYRANLMFGTILVLGITSFASAQTDENSQPRHDQGGWVIAAFLGGARAARSDLTIAQPALGNSLTFRQISFRSRSFDPPLYYGFRGGYFLDRGALLGLEVEFIHSKVFSDPGQRVRANGQRGGLAISTELSLGDIVQQYSISHGVNLLLVNVAARHRVKRSADAPDGRLILAARVGIGPTFPHTESRVEGQQQEQYQFGRLAWQVAGGAEFKLWKGLYAIGEYKFTRTNQRGKISMGTAESLLLTQHGLFGLSYHF
jgi:Outer membrane protein beta-barrel domain